MENRQNLLVIMVDQLRYDCLGFTGCPAASTPNLDRLAREGAWFDRAYTSLPVSYTHLDVYKRQGRAPVKAQRRTGVERQRCPAALAAAGEAAGRRLPLPWRFPWR